MRLSIFSLFRSASTGAILSALLLSACSGGESEGADNTEAIEKVEEIADEEDALLGKRDALFTMRRDLQSKRTRLADKRTKVRASGGDTSQIDTQEQALRAEEAELSTKESELDKLLRVSMKERRQLIAAIGSGGAANNITAREAGLASRERTLAKREKTIAEREAALARRESTLATKWKDDCALGGGATTIIRTVDASGTSYSKKDVEPLLSKARREMAKKGILASDLPAQARGLEKEANAAMKKGDYGRARLASSQLVKTVKAISVNRGFIAAKIQRLNGRMKGKSLSSRTEGLFRDATARYGDGKFSSANKKLNQIYSSLR
ncbi:MAG: hypothetical protein JKY56_12590 [Kofleriaceae bacterium]|nr:hypothetical protein [Kofleriaceae bacterium]